MAGVVDFMHVLGYILMIGNICSEKGTVISLQCQVGAFLPFGADIHILLISPLKLCKSMPKMKSVHPSFRSQHNNMKPGLIT